jgi:lactate dehydrogenase-like 2-hydroxyacid dehydrogenase
MRPAILQFTGMAGQLAQRLKYHFECYPISSLEDVLELPDNIRKSIRAVALSGMNTLDGEIVTALPSLEIVSCYGVGYDGVDAADAARRGIIVTHTPDVLNDEVANTAIALLLATTRKIVAYDKYVRQGRWAAEGSPPLTHGLAGKTVGIVGLGRIGTTIAAKLGVFNCEIVYHARNRRDNVDFRYYEDLEEMARACDALIIVIPGGPSTRHMISRKVLESLGSQGTLINIARGSVIDEKALVECLQSGTLGAAGLDVFENEPHVPSALISMDSVILLPHVGSATLETRSAMAELAVNNLVSWFESGKVLSPVPECRDVAAVRADQNHK